MEEVDQANCVISDFELWIWTLSIEILDMAKLEHEDALPENNTALSAV